MLIHNKSIRIGGQGGFSLIELAIVLMIIGALIGSFIGTLGSRIESSRYIESKSELDDIKVAFYGYASSQGFPHLPCPDCRTASCAALTLGNFANDGIEDRNGVLCDANVDGTLGNLPWQTLGIGEIDPWGNRYSYWVSDTIVDNTATAFQLVTVINSATINTRIGDNIAVLTDTAAAIVFSHGSNGFGAISADAVLRAAASSDDEVENANNDNVFVSRNITEPGSETTAGDDFEFDDMLIWVSEYELKGKMVQAGALP